MPGKVSPQMSLKLDFIIITASFTARDAAAMFHTESRGSSSPRCRQTDRRLPSSRRDRSVLQPLYSCSGNPALTYSLSFSPNYPQDLRGTLGESGFFSLLFLLGAYSCKIPSNFKINWTLHCPKSFTLLFQDGSKLEPWGLKPRHFAPHVLSSRISAPSPSLRLCQGL